jgi:hypothetical protein
LRLIKVIRSPRGDQYGEKVFFGSKTDKQLVFYELLALIPRYV